MGALVNCTHVNDPSCQCDACQRDRSKTFAKKNQALADAMHARRRVSHPTEYDDAKPTNCPHGHPVGCRPPCGACVRGEPADKEYVGYANCPPCPHRSAGAPACNDCRAVALEDLVHFLVGAVHEPWIGPFVNECMAKIDEGKPWRTATK